MPRDPCSPQNPGATFGLLADATASEANFPELERPHLSYRSWPPPVAPRGTFSTLVDAPVEFDRGVTASEIWEHGATALRSQLAPNTWGLWFQGVRAVSLTDDVLTLAVPSSLAADRIRSSYTGMLADTLRDVTGQQLRVELTVETDTRPEEALPSVPPTVTTPHSDLQPPVTPEEEPSRLWATGGLNPRYTFDQFVIGASNRFAHAAALSVAEAPARSYNPLFIYGAAGLGKTHLLHAIGHHVKAVFRNKRVRYVSTETFMSSSSGPRSSRRSSSIRSTSSTTRTARSSSRPTVPRNPSPPSRTACAAASSGA